MIALSTINWILNEYFTGLVQQRGYYLFQEGQVMDIDFDPEDNEFLGQVIGEDGQIYTIYIELDRSNRDIIDVDCNCDNEECCEHLAAGLIAYRENTPHLQRPAKRGRSRKNQVIEINRGREQRLATKDSSVYRELPIASTIYAAARLYSKSRDFNSSIYLDHEVELLPDNEFDCLGSSYHHRYSSTHVSHHVRLKKEAGKLFIKCLSCKKNTAQLCEHQAAILSELSEFFDNIGLLSDEIDYDKISKIYAGEFGIDAELFHNYFRLIIGNRGIMVVPGKNNIVAPDWVESFKEEIDQSTDTSLVTKKIEERLLKTKSTKEYAYFWLLDDDEGNADLKFLVGKGYKNRTGIQAHAREFKDAPPPGFPREQQELSRQLYFLFKEDNTILKSEQIKQLMMDHLDLLNESYQYAYNDQMYYGRMQASDTHQFTFDPEPLNVRFYFSKKDGMLSIRREIIHKDQPFDYANVLFTSTIFCVIKDRAYFLPNPHFYTFMGFFNEGDEMLVPRLDATAYMELVSRFKKYFEVIETEELKVEEKSLSDPTFQILLREIGEFVAFEPRIKYDELSFNAFEENAFVVEEDEVLKVDKSDQQFLVDFLKSAHPEFDNPVQLQEFVYLEMRQLMNNYWFIRFNESCAAAGIQVLGEDQLKKFKYSKFRAKTATHIKSGIDWFDVDMSLSFGKETVKTADWIRALRNNESFVTLKNGSLGILPEEWLEQARKILAIADVEKGDIKISKYRFNVVEDLFDNIDDKKIIKELEARKRKLAAYDTNKKYELPEILDADLRNYQKHGFAWLKFLDESGFGGILADDMGLGKTVQVISLLADQIENGTSLIVVPRSLLFNWAAELDKFCPTLTYIIHHGPGRVDQLEEVFPIDLIITTYDTAASDIKLFKNYEFNYIILDESQAIKNSDSKRYKAMRVLQSRNKIAMTGTPIENNTFDLYSQLSFTSPGLLGTKTSFKNNFAIPIDTKGDKEAAQLLQKMIHPFVLRRTKELVASDLPDKTETVIYCEMGSAQRRLYNNLKKQIKEDIEAEIEEKGMAKSKFKMLDGLLRLRQMCNSPLLLNGAFSGSNAESVKINILMQNLTEELDNHNALVFSQFTSLLAIVRRELDKRGVKYAYLDGSTTKRQKEVEKFMEQEDIQIFLISIKAGNTGLNLTKADYVYILDPWWNPAVEAQAIDRTHRIGQDKQIFAYKLICKDSIEEKILQLQEKKKKLAKELIRTDDNIIKSLDKDELMSLFD